MPSSSKSQQRFFGVVKAMQKGDIPKKGKAGKVSKSMKKKDIDDFASTKHKGLPNKMKQETKVRKLIRKMVREIMKEGKLQEDFKNNKWEVYVADEKGKEKIMKVAKSKRAGVILYNKLINTDKYHEVGMRVIKEGNIGITTKKGKTIELTHKTSGKEIVVVNNSSVLKKYKKLGYLISMPEGKLTEKVKYKKDKKIDGKWYTKQGTHKAQAKANVLAKREFGRYYDTKVVKEKGGYTIYVKPLKEEKLTEGKFSKEQLNLLKLGYGSLNKLNPSSPTYKKFIKFLEKLPKDELKQLANADIKFVSMLAKNRIKEGKLTEAKESGIDVARRIVKNKQHEKGVDMQTANLIMKIHKAYDKNPALQKKLEKLPLKKLAQGVWRFVK